MTDTDTGQRVEDQVVTPGAGGTGTHPPERGVPAGGDTPERGAETGSEATGASSLGGDGNGPGEVLQGEVLPDEADDDAAEIEGDLDELASVAGERDQYLALAQRTQADFENYRKRVARESAAAQERGVAKLAKELLPALDNLDRALDAAAQDDPLLDGVRLVRGELSAGLARVGIESFGAAGDTFDPVEHEAVAQQPVVGAESGSVVEVYQPGYRLGASIIRPARVLVAA
jgi:molecular chaperone GrpE